MEEHWQTVTAPIIRNLLAMYLDTPLDAANVQLEEERWRYAVVLSDLPFSMHAPSHLTRSISILALTLNALALLHPYSFYNTLKVTSH